MVKDKKEKLEVIKEERKELSEKLSKDAEDAMKENNFEELGKIVENAKTCQVTINANIKSTLKYNK